MRALRLATPEGTLSLPAALVGRLEPIDAIVPVPRAPEGILGLAEVRGGVVALLDARPWLAPAAAPAPSRGALPPSALILAPPHEHLALLVPAGSRFEPAGEAPVAATADIARWLERLAAAPR